MITGRKEQYKLHFHRDRDNSNVKDIWFDLRDSKFYRALKNGDAKELSDASVGSFFRGLDFHDVKNSFEDKTFARLMGICNANKTSGRVRNFGTIFQEVGKYLHLEGYLLLGLNINSRYGSSPAFTRPASQFSKQVLRFMRELGPNQNWDTCWEDNYVKYKKVIDDVVNHVRRNYFMDLEIYRLVIEIFSNRNRCQKWVRLITKNGAKGCTCYRDKGDDGLSCGYPHCYDRYVGFGCEYKALFNYVVKVIRTEAHSADSALDNYHDYLDMMRQIERNKVERRLREAGQPVNLDELGFPGYGRIEKYPRWLTVRHNIVAKNYRDLKENFDDVVFEKNSNQHFSWKRGAFQIVVPAKSQEVKDEGSDLHHCVASYVKRVIDGTTQIVFLRNSDTPDDSLVTVEIRNNEIIQARGYNNRECEPVEIEWLENYAKAKNLSYRKSRHDKSKPCPTPNKSKEIVFVATEDDIYFPDAVPEDVKNPPKDDCQVVTTQSTNPLEAA